MSLDSGGRHPYQRLFDWTVGCIIVMVVLGVASGFTGSEFLAGLVGVAFLAAVVPALAALLVEVVRR